METIGLDDAARRLGTDIILDFFEFFFVEGLIWIDIYGFVLDFYVGVERRRIYDIVNVLESIGVRSINWNIVTIFGF